MQLCIVIVFVAIYECMYRTILKHIHIIAIHVQEVVLVGDRRSTLHRFDVRSDSVGQHLLVRQLLRTDHVHHMLDFVRVIVGADLTIAIGDRRRWRIGHCRVTNENAF